MPEKDDSIEKDNSDRILIEIRELFRGTAVIISLLAGLTANVTATAILAMLVIVLWHASTWFHPTKATVLNGSGEFDGRWISVNGRFFGRPFELSI